MVFVRFFDKFTEEEMEMAGGKGASLAKLYKAGFTVPYGFVIGTDAFLYFLKQHDLLGLFQKYLNTRAHNIEDAYSLACKIQKEIYQKKIPNEIIQEINTAAMKLKTEKVAVRSSANDEDGASDSWAGQLDSFLNVSKEDIETKIKEVWISFFDKRVISYRYKKKINGKNVSVAVIVQEMVDAEKAGVAFSAHPVYNNKQQILIEAVPGLGEKLVAGEVNPDSYIIDKEKLPSAEAIVEVKNIKGQDPALNEKEIVDLALTVSKIEEFYTTPQDVEWAIKDGKVYIIQSRPITTLDDKEKNELNFIGKDSADIKKKKYFLHFTNDDFDILTLDMMFSDTRSYGEVDYIVFFQEGITRAFLSKNGMEEAEKLSEGLLDDAFFNSLFHDFELLINKMNTYKVPELNRDNFLDEWRKYKKIHMAFSRLYRFFEQPFQQALEKCVLNSISEDELLKVLKEEKYDAVKNKKSRQCIKKLIKAGKFKLKIHEQSDNGFFSLRNKFLRYLSTLHKVPYQALSMLTADEIEDLFLGKQNINVVKIADLRRKGSVFVRSKNKEWKLYTGAIFSKYLKQVEGSFELDEKTIIKGEVAYPGKAKGKAVVLMSWSNNVDKKIPKGSILVSGMTSPYIVPFLDNVAAIVTDEGGIASHAAIIAREFKIPCIVGTGLATKLIKDGDFVEVDANKGMVKLLSK